MWKRKVIGTLAETSCVLCDSNVESLGHLLFTCTKSVQIWQLVYAWSGHLAALQGDCKSHYLHHRGMVRGSKLQQLWLIIWFSVIWFIWLMWNNIIFKQEQFDVVQIMDTIKVRSWNWFSVIVEKGKCSFSDWCVAPMVCLVYCG